MKNFVSGLFLMILLSAATAVGQTEIDRPDPTRPVPDYRVPRLTDELKELGRAPSTTQREPRVVTRGPLALSDQDQANYAGLLAQSNTGLVRLIPRINPKSAFAFPGKLPAMRGAGAYYSFHYQAHEYGYGSDLELQAVQHFKGSDRGPTVEVPPNYILSVGFAGADFGMLTNIGEVSLSDLTSADARAAYLLGYEPPRAESEARAEYVRFGRVVAINGQAYKRSLPLHVGATYLLRSISYGVSDVLVAFQVVRQESDGSVVIGWKILKRYRTPALKRNQ